MEVNADQKTDVMLQGVAHNASTIDRDMDMVLRVLDARGEHEKVAACARFQRLIHEAYALMLEEYGVSVAEYAATDAGGRVLVGSEKHTHTIMEEIKDSTEQARADETR